jgi:phenylacetate-CoA ligase
MECGHRNGLHLNDRHFIAEIIDPVTEEVLPDGEEGELVITTITKEAMPLVRYRTRDLTRIIPEACPCGRTGVRLERVKGRSDDMIIIRGVNVFPSQVEAMLDRIAGLSLNYQLEITEKDYLKELTVHCESEATLDEEATAKLARLASKKLNEGLGIRVGFNLLAPGALERSTGKANRIRKAA